MRIAAMSVTALLIAACDSDEITMKNASAGEVAEEMRGARTASFVKPGRWRQTATLVSIETPGMPPEGRQMMAKAFGRQQIHNVCVTSEQAGNPRADSSPAPARIAATSISTGAAASSTPRSIASFPMPSKRWR